MRKFDSAKTRTPVRERAMERLGLTASWRARCASVAPDYPSERIGWPRHHTDLGKVRAAYVSDALRAFVDLSGVMVAVRVLPPTHGTLAVVDEGAKAEST